MGRGCILSFIRGFFFTGGTGNCRFYRGVREKSIAGGVMLQPVCKVYKVYKVHKVIALRVQSFINFKNRRFNLVNLMNEMRVSASA